MFSIIDQHIAEAYHREKKSFVARKTISERVAKLLSVLRFKWLIVPAFAVLLFSLLQVFVPAVFGLRTLYGHYLEQQQSLGNLNTLLREKRKELASLEVSLDRMHNAALPVALQKLQDQAARKPDVDRAITELYNLVRELFPRNAVDRSFLLNKIVFDTSNDTIVVDGQLSSSSQDPRGGYDQIARFIEKINASTVFKEATLPLIRADEQAPHILIFRALITLQERGESDTKDNGTLLNEMASEALKDQKIKRPDIP